jgi:hypothetical protein
VKVTLAEVRRVFRAVVEEGREEPFSSLTLCSCFVLMLGIPQGAAMDNRISEIRRVIRALRVSMRDTEAIMREQINRDEDCAFVARELLKMRIVMSRLVQERTMLGDNEPIVAGRWGDAWNRSRSERRSTSQRLSHLAIRVSAAR